MSTYRVQLPDDVVTFLTDGGPLAQMADHVRDGAEYDDPGWVYIDKDCIRALEALQEHEDGVLSRDPNGDMVISVEGTGYPVEYVSER